MSDVLTRFFALEALNVIPEVYVALAGIWLWILIVNFFSIAGQQIPPWAKLIWVLVVTLLPILGVFLYCLFCLLRADYSYLHQLGLFMPNRNKG
jgi:hypothetical protein